MLIIGPVRKTSYKKSGLTEKLRHYSRKKRRSEGNPNRLNHDVSAKYLKGPMKKTSTRDIGKVIDYQTFDVVQKKLKISANNSIHKTSPLNNIKLDIAWKNKDGEIKSENEKSKFFLSRQEKRPRPAHKMAKKESKPDDSMTQNDAKKVVVKRLNLRSAMSNPKTEKKSGVESDKGKDSGIVNFMSSRIKKEFFMSIEIKRLKNKLKEVNEKSQYR